MLKCYFVFVLVIVRPPWWSTSSCFNPVIFTE